MTKVNYHTHTPRCKHAQGSEDEYVRAALEGGFSVLGFSDHTPNHYNSDYVPTMRMGEGELPDYVRCVRGVQEKYKDSIRVLCGLECEYFPSHFSWILEKKDEYSLDYLILGNHFDSTDEFGKGFYFGNCRNPKELFRYVEMTTKGMETGEYLYLAHPDLFLAHYPQFDEHAQQASHELCKAANSMGIPMEYNLLGRIYTNGGKYPDALGYPCKKFWEIAAQEGVECIIGVDAHEPAHLTDIKLFDEAAAFLKGLGLKRREILL